MKTSHLLGLLTFGATAISALLIPTGVTPGSYTATDLTVDAYGRITAASNGSGGGGTNGGDVYTSSNNVFTGDNTFEGNTAFSSLNIGTLIATNAYFTTQSQGDNSTNAATTAYVDAAVAAGGGGSSFPPLSPSRLYEWTEFWMTDNAIRGAFPWFGQAISSGTSAGQNSDGVHRGVMRVSSAAGANSGYAFTMGYNSQWEVAAGDVTTVNFRIVNTNATILRLGWQDSATATLPVDGVYLSLTNNMLYGVTRTNNTDVAVTLTGYAVSTNTWYQGSISINDDATIATFNLLSAGSSVWSDSVTNALPLGSARLLYHALVATYTDASSIALVDYDRTEFYNTNSLTR